MLLKLSCTVCVILLSQRSCWGVNILSLDLTHWKLKPQSVWCVCLYVCVSVHSCVWTKCATTACLLANNTFCLFGSHTPVRTGYFKLSHTHTDTFNHAHTDTQTDVSSPILFSICCLIDWWVQTQQGWMCPPELLPWWLRTPPQVRLSLAPVLLPFWSMSLQLDQTGIDFLVVWQGECAYTPACYVCVCVHDRKRDRQSAGNTFQQAFV